MPTVAELDVQINAKDDATATIEALDALIKQLDNDDVDIDIDADADAAQAEIDKLLARLRQLEESDPDIDIDVDAGDAEAEIARLLARLRELGASDPDIDININSAGALAELALLRAELAGLRDETVRIRMNSDEVRRSTNDMNGFRQSAMNASRSMRPLTAAVLTLGTALIPIGAVGVAGLAALTTAFAAAGIGAGLFAAVAVTAFGPVKTALKDLKAAQDEYNKATTDEERDAALKKTQAIMEGLDPSVRKMVQSILDFKTAWHDFAAQFQPQIFQIAQEGLAGLTALLPSLAPLVQGASDAFLSLERSLVKSLGSPWWQSWLGLMGSVMQPLIEGLGRTIGNLITAFAGLMAAFMPLTLDFVDGMEKMSGAFADWAKGLEDNQGFQNFIAYVRENTPLVLNLIAALAGAFVALVKAGAPLGEALVIIATNLFNAITAFQQAHPLAATMALALIAILAAVTKLAGPLLAIVGLFEVLGAGLAALASPMGLLILAFIAIVGGLVYAYTHFESFKNLVDTVAGAIADFAVKAYNAIVDGLGAAMDWLSSTFGPAIQTVMDFAVQQFDKIMTWVHENSATFQEAWQTIIDFVQFSMVLLGAIIGAGLAVISAIWNAIWPTLSEIIRGVWEAIKGIISGALDAIMGTILIWAGILAGDWGAIWDGWVQVATGAWEMIAGIVQGGFIILQAIATAAGAVLMAILGLLWAGIVAAAQAAWDGIIAGLSAAWATITALWSPAWAVITAIFTAAQATIQAGVNAFWAAIGAIFAAAWAVIQAGMSAFWTMIQTGTQVAMTTIQNIIQIAWAAIQALIAVAMAAIQALIAAAWAAITAVIRTAVSTIQALNQAAWATIQAQIQAAMSTILSVITNGWRTIVNAVQSAMSSIVNAIQNGMSTAASAVSNGISTMVSIVEGAAGLFLAAGASLMANLAQGILNGIGNAVGAVENAVGQLTSLLPGSPAKTGPLSGQGYAMIRGQHLSEDLAAGITGRAGLVARAAGDIADLMTLNLDSGAAFSAIANGTSTGSGDGGGITISIAPGAIVLQVGDGVTAGEARQAFDGAAASFADELLTQIRRR